MSRYGVQFKIQPGQLRAVEKTEIKEAEIGFFLLTPGEKFSTYAKRMPYEPLEVRIENFTLKCSDRYSRKLTKNSDGTVVLFLSCFEVWQHANVSQLLASVEERVIRQVFGEMAKKMSRDDSSAIIPEIAIDLLHSDRQPSSPRETQNEAIFWIKPKEETQHIETVQDLDDIFFNVQGIDHVPHCLLTSQYGLTLQMRNEKHAMNGYITELKKFGFAAFGWYSQGPRASKTHVANLRKNFSDEIIRHAFMLMADTLIKHEDEKRAKGKRKGVPPDDCEYLTLEDIKQELEKRVEEMDVESGDSVQTH